MEILLPNYRHIYLLTLINWKETMTQINETTKKYKIIKFRKSGTQKVMERNLSLDEAKRYCSRPDTKGKNWFCGFTQQN